MAFTYNGKDYTQAQVDQAYAKANANQRAALNKQFKLSYDVNTGKPSQYAPVNTEAIPDSLKDRSVPVTTAPAKGSFGDMAADNVHAQTFENTGKAFEDTTNKYADDIYDISMKEGADKQATIERMNADKLERARLQEEELQRMKKDEKAGQEKLRSDAAKITGIQDQIAARNANASVAQAGESGLQMSQGAMDDIKNDVMAKYGQNIANAKQFELQTNTSIEAALQNIDNNIFAKQDAINTFKNALKDAEFAPVLNALTAAAQGKKDAAKDVLDYYKKYIDMKAAEEYTSVAALNTRDRKDKEWAAATPIQKVSLIKAYAGDTMLPYIDAYINKIGDYGNLSMDMVIGKIAKVAKDDTQLNTAIDNYINTGGKGNALLDSIIAERAKDANRAGVEADLSKDQTTTKVADLTKKDMDGNPNAYNNAENLAFYKGLSAQDKAKFDQNFLAQTKAGVDRGLAFEKAKTSLTAGNVSTVAKGKDTFSIKPENLAILNKQIQNGKKDAAIALLEKQLATETGVSKRATLENSIKYLKQF